MRRIPIAVALALAIPFSLPAKADVELSERGPVAFLSSSRLQPGDEQTVAEFLQRPRQEPLRIVYLDSVGGSTQTAVAIGRMIRAQGLDTAFHVGRARCVSACTTMFLGGVHRYYIGSDGVPDGIATHLGLGFHPSNGGARGEAMINEYYQEMGVPGAADLRYRVYPRESIVEPTHERNAMRMFFAGGRSAVQEGVATSTSEPANPELRD